MWFITVVLYSAVAQATAVNAHDESVKYIREKRYENDHPAQSDENLSPLDNQTSTTTVEQSSDLTSFEYLTSAIIVDESDPCHPNLPDKPNFLIPGRRLSEAKCMDHIWNIKRHREIEINKHACEIETKRNKTGHYDKVPYIEGGRAATPGEFPHMGAIGWKGQNGEWLFRCGSSLISSKFVLTAAHCTRASARSTDIADPVPKIVRVSHVDINLGTLDADVIKFDVEIARIIVHPNYKAPKKYYDIALMELSSEVGFSQKVQPACLWTKPDTTDLGNNAMVTGWGVLKEGSFDISTVLQAADVDIIGSEQCDTLLAKKHTRHWSGLKDHQLCAGKLAGGVDACQGDSGGPLQIRVNLGNLVAQYKLYYVIGVTSFGIGCARRNLPGVYTKVSSFTDWIESIVWP